VAIARGNETVSRADLRLEREKPQRPANEARLPKPIDYLARERGEDALKIAREASDSRFRGSRLERRAGKSLRTFARSGGGNEGGSGRRARHPNGGVNEEVAAAEAEKGRGE